MVRSLDQLPKVKMRPNDVLVAAWRTLNKVGESRRGRRIYQRMTPGAILQFGYRCGLPRLGADDAYDPTARTEHLHRAGILFERALKLAGLIPQRRADWPRCGARTRAGAACKMRVSFNPHTMRLARRCVLHGGLSTGATSPEGKRKVLEALARGCVTRKRKAAQRKRDA